MRFGFQSLSGDNIFSFSDVIQTRGVVRMLVHCITKHR